MYGVRGKSEKSNLDEDWWAERLLLAIQALDGLPVDVGDGHTVM